mmetsp:Transcript_47812/g.116353  ORF Transcript_47812/g.116353 Transcript_47812/m.116353 type:complete len:568 (-) Transcript_47812:183-1886(-)
MTLTTIITRFTLRRSLLRRLLLLVVVALVAVQKALLVGSFAPSVTTTTRRMHRYRNIIYPTTTTSTHIPSAFPNNCSTKIILPGCSQHSVALHALPAASSAAAAAAATAATATASTIAWTSMGLLAVQFGIMPVLQQRCISKQICRSSVVMAQEACKFLLSFTLFRLLIPVSTRRLLWQTWTVTSFFQLAFVPATLYSIQNYAKLVAYQHLSPVTYSVLNQTKTLVTAICCYYMLGIPQSHLQMVSLGMLVMAALVMEGVLVVPSSVGIGDRILNWYCNLLAQASKQNWLQRGRTCRPSDDTCNASWSPLATTRWWDVSRPCPVTVAASSTAKTSLAMVATVAAPNEEKSAAAAAAATTPSVLSNEKSDAAAAAVADSGASNDAGDLAPTASPEVTASPSPLFTPSSQKIRKDNHYLTCGILPLMLANLTSGLAAALGQRALQHHNRNVYVYGMELALCSFCLISLSLLWSHDGDVVRNKGWTYEWRKTTWIPVLSHAFGGLLVGLVTKYAGSVRKGFALIGGVMLSGLFQTWWHHERVKPRQVIGGLLACVSLWMHASFPPAVVTP